MTQHRELQEWVEEMACLCEPDSIVWIDGSEEEKDRLTQEAVQTGEMTLLNQEKLPGCLYHRTAVNDVARTEDLTLHLQRAARGCRPDQQLDVARGRLSPRGRDLQGFDAGAEDVRDPLFHGACRLALQQDRRRIDRQHLRRLEHADHDPRRLAGPEATRQRRRVHEVPAQQGRPGHQTPLDPHFPEDNTIWSCGSGYGGNVLLGKKCLAVRIASYLGKREGWMAEHMLIMGIEDPKGRIAYVAAAFPSACGKPTWPCSFPPEG